MRRAILVGLLAGLVAAVVAVQLASAGVVERVRLADPVRQAHGLPPFVSVELGSPDEYERGTASPMSGTWLGPRFEQRDDPQVSGRASIEWSVRFDEAPATGTEQVVVRHLRERLWTRDQRGGVSIEHVVGGRVIGTVPGFYWLMTAGGSDARVEVVAAFPLERNLHAVVHLDFTDPPTDAYVVRGLITASIWNRGQALFALNRIELHGNLAPKVVGVRAVERGRRVRGKVIDRFLDPVLGARVELQRQDGARWTRVARGKTNLRGFYSLRAGRRGAYRVVVNLAGFKAESRALVAGRGR
jgi:hypothetical protein